MKPDPSRNRQNDIPSKQPFSERPLNGSSRDVAGGWGSRLSFTLQEGCHNGIHKQTARTGAPRRVSRVTCRQAGVELAFATGGRLANCVSLTKQLPLSH